MKSSKLIMGCLATLGLTTGMAFAQEDVDRDAIAERLEPVGELCVQGEDCGTAMAASGGDDSASSGGADGESIYNNVCMACHDTGAAGAPKRGDEAAWSERTGQGFETLLSHAINGFNAMPARGGNPDLSDEEVQAAVAYLVEPIMDVPAEASGSGEAAAEEDAPTDDAATAEQEAPTEEAAGEEATAEADSGLDGEALYASAPCAACHASGAAGAPMIGDAEAWAPRIDKGIEALYESAINGIGAMPPKGGATLPDEEVKAIVDYMVSQAQ
ncbi:c-type cytochrome [Halomonas sp. M4R1S46]|uniref:c-type cytochrome n=1 Tax=Halomonas sp. M4R1S46 TaxID=2982692 RepID=UPI0021E4FB2D|nr:c-type cytochrome [Halomonas sp. M4R1S46]UYG07697.1 c-type cytochrome [Halomonas sp. M4R1S46]